MVFRSLRKFLGNPYFAKSSSDRSAFLFLFIGGHLAAWYECCHVLLHYQRGAGVVAVAMEMWGQGSTGNERSAEVEGLRSNAMSPMLVAFHMFIGVYLYLNSFGNLYKMLTTKVADWLSFL